MKTWYQQSGDEGDIVLSTRVRLARNLEAYPFPLRLDRAGLREVCKTVENALIDEHFNAVDMDDISPVTAGSLVEKHLISPAFASERSDRTLLLRDDESVSIMLCEEDHIRLQVLKSGLALGEALADAREIERKLSEKLPFAYDERIGFLTQCPTNLGTALRASVMLHLPALTRLRKIPALAQAVGKMGLTIRGAFGEGSTPAGDFYQLSNQITLGITEEAAVENLTAIARQLTEQERTSQRELCGNLPVQDAVYRAWGVLTQARLLGSQEFLQLLSLARMGAAQGLLDIPTETLSELLVTMLPATLGVTAGGALLPEDRDQIRAEAVRGALRANEQ
jgi:protein arginine kinase